ncbi:MAG: hypothetical protein V3R83_02630 [Gammaproteobacteria bacterium]
MSNQQPTNSELPAEVIDLLQAGHKIQAIKRLRMARGIGLKDAKETVDAFINENPHVYRLKRRSSGSPRGLLFLVIIIALIVAAYSHFS